MMNVTVVIEKYDHGHLFFDQKKCMIYMSSEIKEAPHKDYTVLPENYRRKK